MLDTVIILVYNYKWCKVKMLDTCKNTSTTRKEMSIKNGVYYAELYNEYANMLTENQRSVFEMYCMCDLSLAEIAEIKNVSRQSVQDSIQKTKKLLDEMESKLRFVYRKKAVYQLIDGFCDEKNKSFAEQIKNILGDY